MWKFFRFRAAELWDALIREVARENILHLLRLEENDVIAEALLVFAQCREVNVELLAAIETIKIVLDKCTGQFTRTVATEVTEDNRVTLRNRRNRLTIFVEHCGWRAKFVTLGARCLWMVVLVLNSRFSRSGSAFNSATSEAVVCALYTIPAVVSIHRPVATRQRCNLAEADLRHFGFNFFDELPATKWPSVATIRKSMQIELLNTFVFGNSDQTVDMLQHRVHACVRHEAHEVQRSALSLNIGKRCLKCNAILHRTCFDPLVDTDELLIYYTTSTDVLVTDFRVAHDTDWQTHIQPTCHDLSARPLSG